MLAVTGQATIRFPHFPIAFVIPAFPLPLTCMYAPSPLVSRIDVKPAGLGGNPMNFSVYQYSPTSSPFMSYSETVPSSAGRHRFESEWEVK